MRPSLLNPLFAAVTSLPGVGPKQDKLLRYLLGRDETPRLVDLLLHLPSQVIDRRARRLELSLESEILVARARHKHLN